MAFDPNLPRPFRSPRIGWQIKRTTGSHRVLQRTGWPDVVFAFHDRDEIGPRMLARLSKVTDLNPKTYEEREAYSRA